MNKKIKYESLTDSERMEYGIFSSIKETYDFIKSNPTNQRGKSSIHWIAHYMENLYFLGKKCDHITEMGVNEVNSSWAFLYANPKKLVCIDMTYDYAYKRLGFENHIWLESLKELSKKENITLDLIEKNTLEIEIEETDLLFIDTLHKYNHLKRELELHANKVKKYIIFHDTTLFPELNIAISEFLENNKSWILHQKFTSNPGLTIIKNIKWNH